MASANTSWSEENFSCSICLDVFSSPVSTPCGHNFCRTCITKYWDEQVKYKCPVCNELFNTRPDLRVNTLLSEMVDRFGTSVLLKEQPCVEPAEVPCDVCTGTQLMAVKSCLVCLISYCQTHLEPHQRVAGLKKHRLVEPMDRLEDRMCKKHDRLLELFCQTDQCQDDLNQMVKERLKSTEKQAEDLIKELEQEIEYLTIRSSEVKQLSHTKDHLLFLQTFRSLKNPPPTRDWTTVEVRPPSYVGTLRRSLDQLEETLSMEMKTLCGAAELKMVQQYEVDVTLDPDTAHPNLILSEDGRQVHDGDVVKELSDNSKRFTYHVYVLTRLSFSSGRFYFEVQVKDKTMWRLGVARESIKRIDEIIVTPEKRDTGLFTLTKIGFISSLLLAAPLASLCIHSCLYVYMKEVQNSAPLIISPVNQTD
ncbi:unnamed protein product [Arctogadus glacialis]